MSAGDTDAPVSGSSAGAARPESRAASRVSKHASITELELQFAQNPKSDAYIDLCEAYMDASRFMEAMVVCKKGIKAHPDSAEAKVLLSRVYARQKKYARALSELDAVVAAHPEAAPAFLARGRVRIETGDDAGATEDLKRTVDLDPEASEAIDLLAERGITYPEPEPEPEPEPAPPAVSADLTPPWTEEAGGPPLRPSSVAAPAPRPVSFLQPAEGAEGEAPPRAQSVAPAPRFGSQVGPAAPYQARPQRLEGEEELEALAQRVAEEEPPRGKPKTTLALLAVLLLVGGGLVGQRLWHKNKIENIDRLTTMAVPLFNRDTYGAYKQAAAHFEEIVDDYDGEHALSLGRLAYVYAILWGEHGDRELEPKLQETLARAKQHAPDVSHTVAAEGLATLYAGKDRLAAAASAVKIVDPMVGRAKAGGAAPTHADLTLGIIELALGEYDQSVRRLRNVKEVLPGSVRAKVWHGRAAFRAGRYSTAVRAYQAALRAEPQHPGARAGLALARLRRGDLEGAKKDLEIFDKVARSHSKDVSRLDNALAEYARSEILRADGEDAKATGAYEQALRLDPANPDFPFGLGKFLLAADRAKEAIEPLRRAVELDPKRIDFKVELAEAEMHLGNYDAAEKQVQDALSLDPDRFSVKLAKARLLRRTDKAEAKSYLEALLDKNPSHQVDVNLELGRYYRSKDQLGAARKALEAAIENMGRAPRLLQGEVLLSYGRLMEEAGDDGVALESYKRAAKAGVMEGWYRVTIALAKAGDRKAAKKACDRYLAAGTSLRYSKTAARFCREL